MFHRGSHPIVLSTHVSKATPQVRLNAIPLWLPAPFTLLLMQMLRSVPVSSPTQLGWACGHGLSVPWHTPVKPSTFPTQVSPAQHVGSESAQFSPTLGSVPPSPSSHGSHVGPL